MADSFFQKFLFSTLLIYTLVSTYMFFTGTDEVYPVFNWDLFSAVPNETTHFFIKIDEKILFGPEINNYFELDYPSEYFFQVQEAGREFETMGESTLLEELEGRITRRPLSYKLVKVVYNPLELKIAGKTMNEEVVGEFLVE